MRALIVLLPLLAFGCAAGQQGKTETAQDLICADPQTRVDKGGRESCTAYYAALRHDGERDLCDRMTAGKCLEMLRGFEIAGFAPLHTLALAPNCADTHLTKLQAAWCERSASPAPCDGMNGKGGHDCRVAWLQQQGDEELPRF